MAGQGGQPTQARAKDGVVRGGKPARTDQIDTKIVRVRWGRGARYILGNGRERQAGEEVGVSVFLASSILEAEVISRKKLYPALDARFGVSYLAGLLEALMVSENQEVHAE